MRTLKSVYPTVDGELKNSISLKKAQAGDGDWSVSKEILGWIINSAAGTISLLPKCIAELTTLLDPPPRTAPYVPKKVRTTYWKTPLSAPGYPGSHRPFLPHTNGPHQSQSTDSLPLKRLPSGCSTLAPHVLAYEAPHHQPGRNRPTATDRPRVHRCVGLRRGRRLAKPQRRWHPPRLAPPVAY